MISCNCGEMEIEGSMEDLLADYILITEVLRENIGVPDNILKDGFEYAMTNKLEAPVEEVKEDRQIDRATEIFNKMFGDLKHE